MKRFLILGVAVVAAVAIYTTAAPAGQQAVTPAQLNALKARVTKLEKRASNLETIIGGCFTTAVPISRYGGQAYKKPGGAAMLTFATRSTDSGVPPRCEATDVGEAGANSPNCAY